MKTKELYIVGGCSGVGKTTLVTDKILNGKTRIHTGNIARNNLSGDLEKISGQIVAEIKKYEVAFLDTHYAAINRNTGHYTFYPGIEDQDLMELSEIERKFFVLIEGNPEVVLQRRLSDYRNRNTDLKQVIEDIEKNRENFYHYVRLTNANGKIIRNDDLTIARGELQSFFSVK
jgi:adenylate kinase